MEIGFLRLAYIFMDQALNFSVANNNNNKLIIMVFEAQWKNEKPWRLVWGNKGVVVWRFGGLTHTQVYHFIGKHGRPWRLDLGDWHIYLFIKI